MLFYELPLLANILRCLVDLMTASYPQLKPLSATASTRYMAVPKLSIEKMSVIQASFPWDTDIVSYKNESNFAWYQVAEQP